jgi:hypothetical protein
MMSEKVMPMNNKANKAREQIATENQPTIKHKAPILFELIIANTLRAAT